MENAKVIGKLTSHELLHPASFQKRVSKLGSNRLVVIGRRKDDHYSPPILHEAGGVRPRSMG
jgi:hypothetical protein